MVQQDGLAGGGADRAGPRDGVANQRVDQGGFPGPSGTAHHGQQRARRGYGSGAGCSHRAEPLRSAARGAFGPPQAGRAAAGSPQGPAALRQGARRRMRPAVFSWELTASSCQFSTWFPRTEHSSRGYHCKARIRGTTKRPRADARDRFRCDPSGIRTRVTAVRGQRTRPLYDGAAYFLNSTSAIQAK